MSKQTTLSNKQQIILLGWQILEYKLAYYRPELVEESLLKHIKVTDETYDAAENRYEYLCATEGIEPTASNMVGFDENRASCRLVLSKYISKTLKEESV
jgi:hypothetical protein